MDISLFQKLKDALSQSNSIGIAVVNNSSLDQMAASLALYLSLEKVDKKVVIASPTNPIVEISSLVGIDKVKTNFGTDTGDLIVSFPYAEGEIDKVSYTLENNLLNIVVKASEKGLSFNEQDVKFIRGDGKMDLLFVVGASSLSALGELSSGDKLKNVKIVNIDDKVENQGFGDIAYVSSNASSVSELVAEILIELGFSIDQDVAQNLLSGMVSATDDFRDPKSSFLAFKMAGVLMQKGATRGRNDLASSAFTPSAQIQSQQVVHPQQTQSTFEQKPVAPLDWLTPKVYKGGSGISTA